MWPYVQINPPLFLKHICIWLSHRNVAERLYLLILASEFPVIRYTATSVMVKSMRYFNAYNSGTLAHFLFYKEKDAIFCIHNLLILCMIPARLIKPEYIDNKNYIVNWMNFCKISFT